MVSMKAFSEHSSRIKNLPRATVTSSEAGSGSSSTTSMQGLFRAAAKLHGVQSLFKSLHANAACFGRQCRLSQYQGELAMPGHPLVCNETHNVNLCRLWS